MEKLKRRPRIAIERSKEAAMVIVHFKKMGRAFRFADKLRLDPPRGVLKA